MQKIDSEADKEFDKVMAKKAKVELYEASFFTGDKFLQNTAEEKAQIVKDLVIGQAQDIQRFQDCIDSNKPYFGMIFNTATPPERHAYLQQLVKRECNNRTEPFNILEVGSKAGQSAITWADAIKKYNNRNGKVFCVDPWEMFDELNPNNAISTLSLYPTKGLKTEIDAVCESLQTGMIFKFFLYNINVSGYKDMIVIIRAVSDTILPMLAEKFDLIYIDGDHKCEQVRKDLINSMPLVKMGGILCGDDYGKVLDVRKQELRSIHPGVTKAVCETFPTLLAWDELWAVRKIEDGWDAIEYGKLSESELKELMPKYLK